MRATPFCIDMDGKDYEPRSMAFVQPRRHVVLPRSAYIERQPIETRGDAHAACEAIWSSYQDVDDEWCTPDGGRSLMTGDLVRIEDGEATSWWICCSIGWTETVAPTDEVQRIGTSPEPIA